MFVVQLILFQVFIFAMLVLALKHILGKNVTRATSHLQKLSDEYIKKEESLKREYSEMHKKYNDTIEKAQRDAADIIDKAQKDARKEATEIVNKARQQSEQIVERAEKCAEQMKKEIENRIESESLARACELIGSTLPENTQKDMHAKWVQELIDAGFSYLERMNVSDDVKVAKVTSAFALKQEELNVIKKGLKKSLKREIELKHEVDRKIIAGIIVKIGNVVLDGSLFYKIKTVADEKKGSSK